MRYLTPILLCLALTACKQKENRPSAELDSPNILFILADDLGYADLGSYGSTYALSPNLDQLAEKGMKFTQFYAASAVCTPTRAAMLTGKYPIRFNITKHFGNPQHYFTPQATTIPELLKAKNYYSATIGKWHLGGLDTTDIDARRNGEPARPGPLEHGFDYYLGALRYKLKVERRLFKDAGKTLVENDYYLPPDSAHWTDINIDYSLKVMEKCHQEGRPFFINLWFDTPHTPYEAAPEPYYSHFKAKVPDPKNGRYNKANQKGDGDFYYSMIEHMDAGIGRLLQKLEELGITENTLVIFTSDNGPSYRGEPGIYKAGKADLHEGGLRVPFIASMPGTIPSGMETNVMANTIDMLPTFCDFANIAIPQDVDGVSLKQLLKKEKAPNRNELFWQLKNYKWYPQPGPKPTPYTELVYRRDDWKLLADTTQAHFLYHLRQDPRESINLIDQYPALADTLFNKAIEIWHQERLSLHREIQPPLSMSD